MFIDLNKIDKRLSSSEQRIVMLSHYEQMAGIRNHEAAGDDPTTLIAMNKSEDPLYFDPMYDKIDLFIDSKVQQYSGTSFEEFMNMDGEYAEYIAFRCRKLMEAAGKKANQLENQLNNVLKDQ